MHPSSIQNLKKALGKISLPHNPRILDVGGRSLNTEKDRSYKPLFQRYNPQQYAICDINDGIGVDILMNDPYSIPISNDFFDCIVSGQTLEHVPNPFKLLKEMKRVLVNNGFILIVVPSKGPRHDKKDYWRFMDDAGSSLAIDCSLSLIESWIDRTSEKWGDNTMIFQKNGE